MLDDHIGILLYFLLPNHWVWKMLTKEEKTSVLNACHRHNNVYYLNPQDYDKQHLRSMDAHETKEGKIIQNVLESYSPVSILEVGPGSGYYTKLLLEHHSVKEYVAIDIVKPFLEYIKNTILPEKSLSNKSAEFICSDFLTHDFSRKFDLIVFMSSLHHIPNREEFIRKSAGLLNEGAGIIAIEPRHGVPRILRLCAKFARYYHKKSFWSDKSNLPTHHFLTFSEIKNIARKNKLKISKALFYRFKGDRYLEKIFKHKLGFFYCLHFFPLSLFAHYVYVRLEKEA